MLDLHSLLVVSEAVTLSALDRRESRGGHTRIDFPDSDPEYGNHTTIVSKTGKQMTTTREPVPTPPDDLEKLIDEGV